MEINTTSTFFYDTFLLSTMSTNTTFTMYAHVTIICFTDITDLCFSIIITQKIKYWQDNAVIISKIEFR